MDKQTSKAVSVIAERRRNCEGLIGVISPTWYTISQDLRKSKKSQFSHTYEPDESALCIACCLASKTQIELPAWEQFLGRLLRREELAGVLPEATFFHQRDPNTFVFERTEAIHTVLWAAVPMGRFR